MDGRARFRLPLPFSTSFSHLPLQGPHDGQRRHVQGDPGAGRQGRLVQLGPAADDVARAGGGLDDD